MQNAKSRMQNASLLLRPYRRFNSLIQLTALLTIMAMAIGCADDRKAPLQTNDPVYTKTIDLAGNANSSGNELSFTFKVDDVITDGRLNLWGFLWPDAALTDYSRLGVELDSLGERLLNLEGQILNISLKAVKTHADSVALDSLNGLKTASTAAKSERTMLRDSLDTRLDDRFKVSIWLDGDVTELYPRAIFLDSAAVSGQIGSDETMVWGQNFFSAPPLDSTGKRGRRMELSLKKFFTADPSYRHNTKPARPANPDQLPELFPITDWLHRLTPGNHTLHVRFGESGVRTEVSVSLYVIYQHAG